jgi:hypothetical protein
MTGFITNNQYLTRLTTGALSDYGYKMNLNSPYIAPYPFAKIPQVLSELAIQCVCSKKEGVYMHKLKINNSMEKEKEFTKQITQSNQYIFPIRARRRHF